MTDHRSASITASTITTDGLLVVVSKEQASNLVAQFGARGGVDPGARRSRSAAHYAQNDYRPYAVSPTLVFRREL